MGSKTTLRSQNKFKGDAEHNMWALIRVKAIKTCLLPSQREMKGNVSLAGRSVEKLSKVQTTNQDCNNI